MSSASRAQYENAMLSQCSCSLTQALCTLYSDSLDDNVKSYIDLIRFDADELYRCLGGQGAG